MLLGRWVWAPTYLLFHFNHARCVEDTGGEYTVEDIGMCSETESWIVDGLTRNIGWHLRTGLAQTTRNFPWCCFDYEWWWFLGDLIRSDHLLYEDFGFPLFPINRLQDHRWDSDLPMLLPAHHLGSSQIKTDWKFGFKLTGIRKRQFSSATRLKATEKP